MVLLRTNDTYIWDMESSSARVTLQKNFSLAEKVCLAALRPTCKRVRRYLSP